MKIRIQFTPVFTVAILCAAGWFVFWLTAFRPVTLRPVNAAVRPEVTRLVADDETLRKLKTPTLFALPSGEGFSGNFLENRVDLHLSHEKPASPVRYLPHENASSSGVDQTLLVTEKALPQSKLPAPGVIPHTAARPDRGAQLFPSPELKPRAGGSLHFDLAASGLPETVRVNLTVHPDGTVGQTFFETPVTNASVLSAVRQLRFKPAAEQTEGWIDIRFTQEGNE